MADMDLTLEDGTMYEGAPLSIVATESEARDLAEALIMYFSESPRDDGWHDHLSDRLTFWITGENEELGIRLGLDGEPLR